MEGEGVQVEGRHEGEKLSACFRTPVPPVKIYSRQFPCSGSLCVSLHASIQVPRVLYTVSSVLVQLNHMAFP